MAVVMPITTFTTLSTDIAPYKWLQNKYVTARESLKLLERNLRHKPDPRTCWVPASHLQSTFLGVDLVQIFLEHVALKPQVLLLDIQTIEPHLGLLLLSVGLL